MPVPFLDLKAQFHSIEAEIRAAVDRVLTSQQFILGEEVAAFEKEISEFLGAKEAIGVASGTDALLLALLALGIREDEEVITTPYSFFATAAVIHRVGARPVFVDIDPATFLIRPDLVARAVTPRTRAILPVHLFGQMAEMETILEVAERHGLHVVEDAAQAIGTEGELNGKPARAGTLGTFGCLSFYPSKNLGAAGDAGIVLSGDTELADRIRSLRQHGQETTYVHTRVGLNSRLDALQAAILRSKLPHLQEWNRSRQRAASRYGELFASTGLSRPDGPIVLPETRPDSRHTYHEFVVRAEQRDGLLRHLRSAGIGCAVYYPTPLHLQPCFSHLGHGVGDFPVAETAATTTLALPIYPEITPEAQQEVVETVRRFYSA